MQLIHLFSMNCNGLHFVRFLGRTLLKSGLTLAAVSFAFIFYADPVSADDDATDGQVSVWVSEVSDGEQWRSLGVFVNYEQASGRSLLWSTSHPNSLAMTREREITIPSAKLKELLETKDQVDKANDAADQIRDARDMIARERHRGDTLKEYKSELAKAFNRAMDAKRDLTSMNRDLIDRDFRNMNSLVRSLNDNSPGNEASSSNTPGSDNSSDSNSASNSDQTDDSGGNASGQTSDGSDDHLGYRSDDNFNLPNGSASSPYDHAGNPQVNAADGSNSPAPQLGSNSSGAIPSRYGYDNGDGTTSWNVNGRTLRLPNGTDPNDYLGNNPRNSPSGSPSYASGANGNSQINGANGNSQINGPYGSTGNSQANGRGNNGYGPNGNSQMSGPYGSNGNNRFNSSSGRGNNPNGPSGNSQASGPYRSNGNNQGNPTGGNMVRTFNIDSRPRMNAQNESNGNTQFNRAGGNTNSANGSYGGRIVLGRRMDETVSPAQNRVVTNDSYISHAARSASNVPVTAARPTVSPVAYVQPSSSGPSSPALGHQPSRPATQYGSSNSTPAPSVTPSMPSVSRAAPGRTIERAALNFD